MASPSTSASASASSSAFPGDHQHQHLLHPACGGIPAPPPPTPSNHSLAAAQPTDADAVLSRLLSQLTPPSLSLAPLPSRFSRTVEPSKQRRGEATPPAVSLVQPHEAALRSAASEFGFFHLIDHGIPSDLAARAHLECQSLFRTHPRDLSPLGFDVSEAGGSGGGDDDDGEGASFLVVDVADGEGLPQAVCEYARHLERVGMEVVEMISLAGGFHNPFRVQACRPRFLLWISDERGDDGGGSGDGVGGDEGGPPPPPPWRRCYPYVVCLQYEMRSWNKCMLLDDDGGWITLAPHAESLLVAVGDIAQVWSNGEFKKVRGRPASAHPGDDGSRGFTVSLLVTLPTDGTVSPLPPAGGASRVSGEDGVGDGDDVGRGSSRKFSAFPFEQYAWRLFHEQLPFADPLRRYRL